MKINVMLPLALLLGAQAALATSANYPDFSSIAGLTLNGNAAQSGNVLRLVPSVPSQAGTTYLSSAVPLDALTGFSTSFRFNISTDLGDPTDGFTFLLHNDGAGVTALGAQGQGLGYAGLSPSVAVVFRGRNPNLIGVITGGVDPADLPIPFQPPGYYSGTEGEFYNQVEYAWIDYDPTSTELSVFLSTGPTKPGTAIMSTAVDIFGTLGSQAFVGFSAGNGGAFGNQDILSWSFNSSPVPEAGSAGMMALGLLMLRLGRRRSGRQGAALAQPTSV